MSESAHGSHDSAVSLSPDELARRAIDNLSAAMVETQLLLRKLSGDHPARDAIGEAVARMMEAGETLAAIRDTISQ